MASQTNTESGVPFYKIGTIGGKADAYISKELFDEYKMRYNYPNIGEVMITCAGTVGKCVIYNGEDSYYQDSNIVWIDNPKKVILNDFLYLLLSRINWSYLNSTTITRIYNDDLRNLVLHYPKGDEQNKITNLLRLLDKRIETQIKVIEDLKKLKSAIIEKEYAHSSTPVVRLADLIEQKSIRNKEGNIKSTLSVSNKCGFVNQDEQFEGREIASEDKSNYKIVTKGDFAYNPARINVGSIARLESNTEGIVSPMYIIFAPKDAIDGTYLLHFLESKYFADEVKKRLEGSVRLCLSFEALCQIAIPLPNKMAQVATSKRISTISKKIELEEKVLKAYNEQKQYLLRHLFI